MSEEYEKINPEIADNGENTDSNTPGVEILADLPDDFDEFRAQQEAHAKAETSKNTTASPNNNNEAVKNKEYLMVEQQREDLSVLLSFCDEKDVMDILYSDGYGKLLENQISLMDLFNANVLFNEQYYGDGFTRDYENRHYVGEDSIHKTKLDAFKHDRQKHIEEKYRGIEYYDKLASQAASENDDLMREKYEKIAEEFENDQIGGTREDKIRAEDAKQLVTDLTKPYYNESYFNDLRPIIKTRASGEELSKQQKDFLRSHYDLVADRLLYDGKVITPERADNIYHGITNAINEYTDPSNESSYKDQEFRERLCFTAAAIDDFYEHDRFGLVSKSARLLKDAVESNFDEIFSNLDDLNDGYVYRYDELFLKYSNHGKMIERAKKYDLVARYDEDGHIISRGEIDANDLVDHLVNYSSVVEFEELDASVVEFLAGNAKELKELGADDETILKYFGQYSLQPESFFKRMPGVTGGGIGIELINAGIDRHKILDKMFCDVEAGSYFAPGPFENAKDSTIDKSRFDYMKEAGFSATEIAQIFNPEVILDNLQEFVDRGADTKELLAYMMSYLEVHHGASDYDFIVKDKNHSQFESVYRKGMEESGDGSLYVAANLDKFAKLGITAEDVFEAMDDSRAEPWRLIVPEMINCGKFDPYTVMNLGYQKTIKFLEGEEKEYLKNTLDPIRYAADVQRYINDINDNNRNPVHKIKNRVRDQLQNPNS